MPWPERSQDLTLLNFYLLGHMQTLIDETSVESEMNLVGRIVDAAGFIADNPRVFERFCESLLCKYQTCIIVQGLHFEQLLYYPYC